MAITQLLWANNAATKLASPLTSSSTSATLSTGTGALFPNPSAGQYFLLTLNDALTGLVYEIVKVTARAGDVLTIVRGQEGTAAVAWLANDLAVNMWTAGSAAWLVQESQLQANSYCYAADTGTVNNIVIALTRPSRHRTRTRRSISAPPTPILARPPSRSTAALPTT